ncbi:hypothetical protein N9064_00735 [bacterium]|nr:hypothetical protein [bacterium]
MRKNRNRKIGGGFDTGILEGALNVSDIVGDTLVNLAVEKGFRGYEKSVFYEVRRSGDNASSTFTWAELNDGKKLSENLVTNGDFEDGVTGWDVIGVDWEIIDGVAVKTGATETSFLEQYDVFEIGKTYSIYADVLEFYGSNSAGLSSTVFGESFYTVESAKPLIGIGTAINATFRIFGRSSQTSLSYDNIQVYEYQPSTAEQWVIDGGGTQMGEVVEVYDQSYKVIGPELVVNGGFDTDTDWTKGTGWSIGSGVASCDGLLSGQYIRQDLALVLDANYVLSFEITTLITGGVRCFFGNTNLGDFFTPGKRTIYIQSDGADLLRFYSQANFTGSIDNISIREIDRLPNNATQSVAAYQPTIIENGALMDGMRFDSDDHFDLDDGLNYGLEDFWQVLWIGFDSWKPSSSSFFIRSHGAGNNRFTAYFSSFGQVAAVSVDNSGFISTAVLELTPSTIPQDGECGPLILNYDRDENLTAYFKGDQGTEFTASADISSTATINIGDANTNNGTIFDDLDTTGKLKTFITGTGLLTQTQINKIFTTLK